MIFPREIHFNSGLVFALSEAGQVRGAVSRLPTTKLINSLRAHPHKRVPYTHAISPGLWIRQMLNLLIFFVKQLPVL